MVVDDRADAGAVVVVDDRVDVGTVVVVVRVAPGRVVVVWPDREGEVVVDEGAVVVVRWGSVELLVVDGATGFPRVEPAPGGP